ncbi:MAG: sugar lactone lactonase YvrE [Bradymonadia bacterium]|jgi:sugar lactone lactonase YvrE
MRSIRRLAGPSALLLSSVALAACGDDDPAPIDQNDVIADTADVASDVAPDVASDTGVEAEVSDAAPDVEPSVCWDDLAVGEFEVFYDGLIENSEGIAFGNDGRLYVTSGDIIFAFDADAEREEFATIPTALGLAPTTDGFIVAAIGESNSASEIDGSVWHVTEAGEPTMIVDGIASPNFVTVMPDGSALISDDFDTRVFRVTRDGDVTEAIVDIASPNGMGYSPDGQYLMVASTFTQDGEVTRIPVDANGMPQPDGWERVAELGAGATLDGLAIDIEGNTYVAANLRHQIVRIPADGAEPEIVGEGLGTPASLAFGNGEGFDPCSIYSTQLFGRQILRTSMGIEGAPLIP